MAAMETAKHVLPAGAQATVKSKETVRVYFRTHDVLRRFYWVAMGSDGSVYFGSSSAAAFRRGYTVSTDIPVGGIHVNPELLGRPMSIAEIRGKESFHAAGTALRPTMTDGRRMSYRIPSLAAHEAAVPLATVLPMELTRYHETRKAPREMDIVIDADPWLGQPFAVLMYLKRPDRPTPPVVEALTAWDRFTAYSSRLGGLELWAALYANMPTFTHWQELEYSATARPKPDGSEFLWVRFRST